MEQQQPQPSSSLLSVQDSTSPTNSVNSSVKRHSVPVNINDSPNANNKDWKFMEENIENIYLKQQRRLSNNSNKTKVILTKIPKRNTIAMDSGLAETYAYQQQQQQQQQQMQPSPQEESHIPIFHFRVQSQNDKRKAIAFSQNMFENLLQQQQQQQQTPPQPQQQQFFFNNTQGQATNNMSPSPSSNTPTYDNMDVVEKLISSKQFKFNLESNNRAPGIVKQSKRYSTELSKNSSIPTSPTATSSATPPLNFGTNTASTMNPLLTSSNASSPRDNSSALLHQQIQQMSLLSQENVRLSGENQQLKHDKLLLEHRVNELSNALDKMQLQLQQYQQHLLYHQQQQQHQQQQLLQQQQLQQQQQQQLHHQQQQQQQQQQHQQQQQNQNSFLFQTESDSLLSPNSELDDLLFN